MKRKFSKIVYNEEFWGYLTLILIIGCIVSIIVYIESNMSLEYAFRYGYFHVISILSTTGYTIGDYTIWSHFLTMLFFLLMFCGGSTSSTAGGIKIARILILIKSSLLELKKQIHPNAILLARLNTKKLGEDITYSIFAFIVCYMLLFFIGVLIMSLLGMDFLSSMGAVLSCLSNIGPGLGEVGPSNTFLDVPSFGKWVLSSFMLIGRLELFTVLILFTTFFWKKY